MQATLERMRQRREERGDEGGFTLIELLIVIVILAILAAIVVFAVQNLTGSSAKAACESDVQTVDHAVQAYDAQMGKAAANVTTLLTGPVTGVNGDQVGPWLHNTPTNGNHYEITVTNDVIKIGSPGPTFTTHVVTYTPTTMTTATACQFVTS